MGIISKTLQYLGKSTAYTEKALISSIYFMGEGFKIFSTREEKIFSENQEKNLEILTKRKENGELTVITSEDMKSLLK